MHSRGHISRANAFTKIYLISKHVTYPSAQGGFLAGTQTMADRFTERLLREITERLLRDY